LELQKEIEIADAHLKELNRELAQIEEVDLPRAMMAAGSAEFKMTDGGKITLKDVIQGTLAKDETHRDYTINWVTDNGGEENIKRHFEIDYTRGNTARANFFRKLLQDHKIGFDEFESIHAQTLYAFLREKLEEAKRPGSNVGVPPFEDMGLRYFKKAVIKPKKEVNHD
jgi:hypothetical protein